MTPEENINPETGESGMPKPTITALIQMLFMQGMISAGKMMNPLTNKYETDLKIAKYQVELIEMLEEKTRGNRTKEEDEAFDEILHQMRLAFIDASRPR